MNFNRRQFLRSAAGLLVASAALAVPERRVFALDQTMIPQEPGYISLDGMKIPVSGPMPMPGDYPVFDPSPMTIRTGDYITHDGGEEWVISKYDLVRVDGKYWGWIVDTDLTSCHSDVAFTTAQDHHGGIERIGDYRIETARDIFDAAGVESADWV